MNATDKANELVDKYYRLAETIEWTEYNEKIVKAENFNNELGTDVLIYWNKLAQQSALIAVDEIMKAMDDVMLPNPFRQYWDEVKEEIEKL